MMNLSEKNQSREALRAGAQRRQRMLAGIITALLLLLMFLLMSISALPQRDLITEHYDDIDWMRFTPQPLRPEQPQPAAAETQPRQRLSETPAIKRIDLSQLNEQLKIDATELQVPSTNRQQRSGEKVALSDLNLSDLANDLNLSMDQSSPLTALPQRGRGAGKSGGLEIGSSSAGPVAGGSKIGGSVSSGLSAPVAAGKQEDATGEIDLAGLAEFEKEFGGASDNYRALIEWMKRNPAELPPVAKRFMDYGSRDLTSRVRFNAEGRSFEMLLLCVEATYEVRIVLIENRSVTYLIDQGFKKQSNFLRTGNLDRLPDKSILKFSTNLKPAEAEQTARFYRLFLSWWESVKK